MYSYHNAARLSRDLKRLFRGVSRFSGTVAGTPPVSNDVARPARIPRGPTDILKALAGCVKDDPTAPNYRFHDDPFLIPVSNTQKRAFALSAEAGRRAAAWIRSEHESLFSTRVYDPPTKKTVLYHNADPPIESYMPQLVWNAEDEASEADVQKLISLSRVEDSITAYRSCKEPLSLETKLALLQLMAYNNCSEPLSERWTEERWFRQGRGPDGMSNTWKANGLAEELFLDLKGKSSEAYCAIIMGMCKYHQATRAYQLTQEARESGIQLSAGVYNGLLRECGFLKQSGEQRRGLVKQLLIEMNEQNLIPDVCTLNAALEGVFGPGAFSGMVNVQDKEIAASVLAEMERVGVVPSAGTWYLLLCIYCRERGPKSDILRSIVARLEQEDADGKPDSLMPPRDIKDTFFFVTAMQVCSDHLQDTELAKRVDDLLRVGERKYLLADSYKESIYRRHQVSLYSRTLPLEDFLAVYDNLVPNKYIPEPSVMESILTAVGVGLTDFADKPVVNAKRVEKFWDQIVAALLARRQKILELMLQISALAVKLEDLPDEKVRLAKVCKGIWQTIEDLPADRPASINWTGDMLANMLIVYQECDDWENALPTLVRLRGTPDSAPIQRTTEVYGVPKNPDSIVKSVKWAIDKNDPKIAASLVTYLYESGFPEASQACTTALSLLMAPEEVKHYSGASERELSKLDGYLKELLTVHRTVPEMSNTTSSSTSSDSSSSDDEKSSDGKTDFNKEEKP